MVIKKWNNSLSLRLPCWWFVMPKNKILHKLKFLPLKYKIVKLSPEFIGTYCIYILPKVSTSFNWVVLLPVGKIAEALYFECWIYKNALLQTVFLTMVRQSFTVLVAFDCFYYFIFCIIVDSSEKREMFGEIRGLLRKTLNKMDQIQASKLHSCFYIKYTKRNYMISIR